jgi:hypothetical protein
MHEILSSSLRERTPFEAEKPTARSFAERKTTMYGSPIVIAASVRSGLDE